RWFLSCYAWSRYPAIFLTQAFYPAKGGRRRALISEAFFGSPLLEFAAMLNRRTEEYPLELEIQGLMVCFSVRK
ncbi:MAG TPA: hypothetical protein VMJ32_12470, partial [Pirellulales bacterium]|nr:hypothetical protein [Pirellulales bacterium]